MANPQRECQLCGRPAPLACQGCGAVFYCNEAHRRRHAAQLGHDADECRRWAASAAPERRQELAGHPGLPWAAATHSLPPCAYLSQFSLHCAADGKPGTASAWLRECACSGPGAAPWGAVAPLQSLWEASGAHAAALPAAAAVSRADVVQQLGGWLGLTAAQTPCLLSAAPCNAAPPRDWAAYYRIRGLPPESPVALLLDSTLTLYLAVLRLHRQLAALQNRSSGAGRQQADGSSSSGGSGSGSGSGSAGGGSTREPLEQLPQLLPGRRLVLHLLGPQRELDQWPLLLELACLLPQQLHIDLHLIGPDVPAAAQGHSLHVAAPADGPCGRPGCTCAVTLRAAGQHASVTTAERAAQQPAAGSACSMEQQAAGRMVLTFWRGAYHDVAPGLAQQHGPPHAVVAPNAGLAAYMSWVPTLQLLLDQMHDSGGGGGSSSRDCTQVKGGSCSSSGAAGQGPLVCCFTDYNAEAVYRSQQLVGHLLASQHACRSGDAAAGVAMHEELNCFRKPAAVLASDNALPSASNGFALWLERLLPC